MRIQSKKHKIGTFELSKISLPCFDDKIFVLDDEIHALIFIKFLKSRFSKILADKKRF